MEDAVVDGLEGIGVGTGKVLGGGLLEYEVVAHPDEVGVAFHQFQTAFGIGLHALKQLNQLHEYARVGGIEQEGPLHQFERLVVAIEFVEIRQGKVAPYHGRAGVEGR